MRGQSSKFLKFKAVGSSFSQKDALTPLTPSAPSSPSLLPLRKRRLPLPTGSHPTEGWPPLRPAPSPLLAVGLAAGDSPLKAPYSQPALRARLCPQAPPLQAATPATMPASLAGCYPCERRWPPLRAGPDHGLVVGGRPCKGAARGWPPILLAAFGAKMQQECVEQFYAI
ncbi:hypothetical protein GW17_00010967 [Ensete ventricosum]|nr:hypothetical protein GW17_00010967 [Ensete ventricosum]